MLQLFQADALRLRIKEQHHKKLRHHHHSKKQKRRSARRLRNLRENVSDQCVHHPMRRTSQPLSLRAHPIRENFPDIHPNHRSLRNRKERDVRHQQPQQRTLVALRVENPRDSEKAQSCPHRSDRQQRLPPQLVNHCHPQQRRHHVHAADRYRLKTSRNLAEASSCKNIGKSRSEEHTSELQSPDHLVCRLLLEKKKT